MGPSADVALSLWSIQFLHLEQACVEHFIGYLADGYTCERNDAMEKYELIVLFGKILEA